MLFLCLSLGEKICHLKFWWNIFEIYSGILAMRTDKSCINTNMLGQLMLDWIICYLNSTGVITHKWCRGITWNSKISQQPSKPNYLSSCSSKSPKLCFSTRMWYCTLFLWFPCNGRSTNEDAVTSDRAAIHRITCPCGIRISMQLNWTGFCIE